MEKFNLFQSYPSRDIQNRTSFFTIFMSILLLVAGVGLSLCRQVSLNRTLMRADCSRMCSYWLFSLSFEFSRFL